MPTLGQAPATDQGSNSFPMPGQGQQGTAQMGGQQQQQPQGDENSAFEQSFASAAQSALLNKHPELASDVVTFKTLNADINKGSAVGAFILQVNGQVLYIPAILSDGVVKPMELVYAKSVDMFLPLSPGWIDEVSNNKVPALGQGVKTPQSLSSDVDLRACVIPPTTGRYSFASAENLHLPRFLEECSNTERNLLRNTLLANPDLLKTASDIYGYENLKHGLTPRAEKTADYAGGVTPTGALYIVDGKSDKANFKKIFGDESPAVMRGIAMEGFYAKDGRKKMNQAVNTEEILRLSECKTNGFYKIFNADGQSETVLVVVNPISLDSNGWGKGGTNGFRYDTRPGNARAGGRRRFGDDGLEPKNENRTWQGDHKYDSDEYLPEQQYLVITSDRRYFQTETPLSGSPATMQDIMGTDLAKMLDEKGDSPKANDKIIFLRKRGMRVEATMPVEVKNTATDSMGVRRISTQWPDTMIVTEPRSPITKITVPEGSDVAFVPADFSAYRVKHEDEPRRYLTNPMDVTNMFLTHFRAIGAHPVTVKEASDGTYYINGSYAGDKIETIKNMANEMNLRVPDVVEILKTANEKGRAEYLVVPHDVVVELAKEMRKIAAEGDKPKPKAKPQDGGQEQDPHAQAMSAMQANGAMDPGQDPSMQAPAPDPSQLMQQAIQEVQDTVQKSLEMNMAELAQKQKALENEMAAMQAIAGRMQELGQGVPKEQSQALQSLEDTHDAAKGAPAGQVDPSAMQSAAGTNDAQNFDTAAIASVVDHSKLHDLVSSYMPTLESGLDHLGRILLSFWVESAELKPALGDQAYSDFEDRLRATFKGLGELVLRIERGAFDTSQRDSQLEVTG
jgi:hypothetical protein